MVEDVGGVVVEVVDGKVTGGPVKNCIGVIGKTGLGSRVRDCKLLKRMVVKEYGKRWYEVVRILRQFHFSGHARHGRRNLKSFKTLVSRVEI